MFKGKIWLLLMVIWIVWSIKIYRVSAQNQDVSKIVFCDVGQGDAILIVDGSWQMIIDGGPSEEVLRCLQNEMPRGDNVIETMVLTHADADHFTGLTAVLHEYAVRELIVNNVGKATNDYFDFYTAVWEEIENEGMKVRGASLGESWCASENVCAEVVSNFREMLPFGIFENRQSFESLSDTLTKFVQKSYDYNNGSIVLILKFVDKLFILTGDAESPQELAMIGDGLLMDIDVLKTGHHGSKSSTSTNFLGMISPEIAVISCGTGNSYGHPHASVLEALGERGVQIYRTDTMGSITYQCDKNRQCEWRTER